MGASDRVFQGKSDLEDLGVEGLDLASQLQELLVLALSTGGVVVLVAVVSQLENFELVVVVARHSPLFFQTLDLARADL